MNTNPLSVHTVSEADKIFAQNRINEQGSRNLASILVRTFSDIVEERLDKPEISYSSILNALEELSPTEEELRLLQLTCAQLYFRYQKTDIAIPRYYSDFWNPILNHMECISHTHIIDQLLQKNLFSLDKEGNILLHSILQNFENAEVLVKNIDEDIYLKDTPDGSCSIASTTYRNTDTLEYLRDIFDTIYTQLPSDDISRIENICKTYRPSWIDDALAYQREHEAAFENTVTTLETILELWSEQGYPYLLLKSSNSDIDYRSAYRNRGDTPISEKQIEYIKSMLLKRGQKLADFYPSTRPTLDSLNGYDAHVLIEHLRKSTI